MTAAEKEYNSPLLQRNMEIIGEVILTATHVKRQECDGPEKYKLCYPILGLNLDQFLKEDLMEVGDNEENMWAKYQYAEDIGLEDHLVIGELSVYPNSGYILHFNAKTLP